MLRFGNSQVLTGCKNIDDSKKVDLKLSIFNFTAKHYFILFFSFYMLIIFISLMFNYFFQKIGQYTWTSFK